MPSAYLQPDSPGVLRTDAEVWVESGRGAGLRFDPLTNSCPPESTLTFPTWKAEALDELWVVAPLVKNMPPAEVYPGTVTAAGALKCVVSVDEGATWLAWDGLAWVPAAPGTWTTFSDLNLHLNDIPFGAVRSLRFKVLLIRGTNPVRTPVLEGLRIGYSLVPDHLFEDVHRTMRRLLVANTSLQMRDTYTAEGGNTLDLATALVVQAVHAVYDLDDDPGRTTNLAVGTFTGTVANLSASPTAGNTLEVRWAATCPVLLANPDFDITDESQPHVPQIVVQVQSGDRVLGAEFPKTLADYVINIPQSHYWVEEPPMPTEYRVLVHALAPDEALAVKLVNAAYRGLRSLATREPIFMALAGTEAEAVNFTQPFSNLTDTSQNLSVKAFTFILYVQEWLSEAVEGPLAETLETFLEE